MSYILVCLHHVNNKSHLQYILISKKFFFVLYTITKPRYHEVFPLERSELCVRNSLDSNPQQHNVNKTLEGEKLKMDEKFFSLHFPLSLVFLIYFHFISNNQFSLIIFQENWTYDSINALFKLTTTHLDDGIKLKTYSCD